jgi:hypothetical protein
MVVESLFEGYDKKIAEESERIRKLEELRPHMLEKDEENDKRIVESEKKIVELNKRIDDQVIHYFKISLDKIRDRIKVLEERTYVHPQTMVKGLENLVDIKIATNNKYFKDEYGEFRNLIERIVKSVV